MKRSHIILYHSIYWIYRVIHIWVFVYFLYGGSWYKGAYVVQLVLMPFFYLNYGVLIPSLIAKRNKRFYFLTFLWVVGFIWVYSRWTIYQMHFLYGDILYPPEYIETLNNLIYIWLISSGVCLFEHWIKNRNKNKILSLDRKEHLLKSEQNIMLNHLLSDYLNALDKKTQEELPDKILLVSDFFKYILYNRDKVVTLKTEMSYIKIYEELKNSKGNCVNISYGAIDGNLQLKSSQVIATVNRVVTILFTNKILEIAIEVGKNNEILVAIDDPVNSAQKEILITEFDNSWIEEVYEKNRFFISVNQYFANSYNLQTIR
jgi:hypothetical protein